MVFLHWVNFVIRKRNSCSHIMRGSWRQHCDHLRVNEPCTHCLTFCFVFFASKRVSEPKALKDASHTVQKNPTQSHYLNADGIAISRNFKQLRRTIHLIFFVVHTPESIYRPSWTEQKYCLCIVMASDSQIQKWWKIQIINTIQRLKPFLDTTVVFPVILHWWPKLIQSSRLYLQHFVRTHN